ncbi:MAG: sigma-70 family RNA polymerase sigma factor [Chloroflexota bacterium]|nr:sigma-70 family RNA polymerase sigma factor [Chloroflexota bacterium]
MTIECEQQVVEQARHDHQAFRQLYRLYFPRVYAYVNYRVGNAQDVEDLVAETFLSVVRTLDSFEWRHDNSFAAWLFRIAHNLISNFYRAGDRAAQPLALDALPEIKDHALLPEDAVLRNEIFSHLQGLVHTLSARRCEVITLKYYAGLQNREIAEVLGLDERTVASHLSRALTDLLEMYQAGAGSSTAR